MTPNVFVKVWRKFEPGLSNYPRLLWSVLIRPKEVVIVDFQGSLGDLVCFFSSLPGLRQRHPRGCLVFVTHRRYLDLVRSTGLADFAAARYGFFHLFAQRLCRPDCYYTPTDVPASEPAGGNVNPPIHTALHFSQLLGVEARMEEVFLRPPERVRRKMKRRLEAANPEALPILVMHVGPTWPVREWPAPYWMELGERLHRDLRVRVIQIGTEAGASELHSRPSTRVPFAVDWVDRLSVIESVALLEQSRLFLGIDSGPLHLATTLGLPTIGLFGPVNGHYRAHPRAPFTCLTANVPCLGCHHHPAGALHWRTGCPYDIRCMNGIPVETVFQAIKDVLKL